MDSENDCIKSFLTKKYGMLYPDRQGMDAFKKFLFDFKDMRVSDFGEDAIYVQG